MDTEDPTPPATPPASSRRVVGKPFQPGGDPRAAKGGRPKTDERLKAAMRRLSLQGVRLLEQLLKDPKTPRRVRAQIAIYACDRRLGRPATAITGLDGAPIIPGAPGENAITQLLARLRAAKSAAPAEPQSSAPAENATPGASGEAGRPS